MSGTMATSGGSTAVDFELFSNGDVDGSITSGGQLVPVTVVDGTDYLQASAAYWQKDRVSAGHPGQEHRPGVDQFPEFGFQRFRYQF